MIKNKEEIKKVLENDGVIAYVTDTTRSGGWAVCRILKKLLKKFMI